MKIEIDGQQATPRVRSGTTNGRDWSFRLQKAWAFPKGAKYPIEIELQLQDSVPAYPEGVYELDLEHYVRAGQYGRITLDEQAFILEPVVEALQVKPENKLKFGQV